MEIPPVVHSRRHPLRFMWQMDQDGRFSLGSDEFTRLIGARTAAVFGRLWNEIADVLGLDPEGRVAAAVATHDTWSGIVVHWPADGVDTRLPVELSGLPLYDKDRNFVGYRGFGVCRDLEGLARLAAQRRDDVLYSASPPSAPPPKPEASTSDALPAIDVQIPVFSTNDTLSHTEPDPAVDETPKNVLPFRSPNDPKAPSLTPGESNAFDELARRLSARLKALANRPMWFNLHSHHRPRKLPLKLKLHLRPQQSRPWPSCSRKLRHRGQIRCRTLQFLDRLPVGVLVYRLDRLIYCNRAFLNATGYDSSATHSAKLAASMRCSLNPARRRPTDLPDSGTPAIISAAKNGGRPADATLFAITWDGEPAHSLMFSSTHVEPSAPIIEPVITLPSEDLLLAEELSTILDTTAEGIVMFDSLGRVVSCNRSAEALFGRDDRPDDLAQSDRFVCPRKPARSAGLSRQHQGDERCKPARSWPRCAGRVRDGGMIPLSITMGRTRPDGARFFAIFRDLSQVKKNEGELVQARRQVERSASAKSDILSKISHEVRTPLNAIIGFADVMIDERFGALGNERYVEYMRTSARPANA